MHNKLNILKDNSENLSETAHRDLAISAEQQNQFEDENFFKKEEKEIIKIKKDELGKGLDVESRAFFSTIKNLESLLEIFSRENPKELKSSANFPSAEASTEELGGWLSGMERQARDLNELVVEITQKIENKKLKEIGELQINGESDIEKINSILGSISSMINLARPNIDKVYAASEKEDNIRSLYVKAKLRDKGFESLEEIDHERKMALDKVQELNKKFLGEFRNRSEKEKLHKKANSLFSDSLDFHKYVRKKIDNPYSNHEWHNLEYAITKVGEEVIKKIISRSFASLNELRGKKGREDEEEQIDLIPQEIIDKLNDDFIEKKVIPEINKTQEENVYFSKRKGNANGNKQRNNILDEPDCKIAIKIIRDSFSLPMGLGWGGRDDDSLRIKKIYEKQEKFKYNLRNVVDSFISRQYEPADKIYQKMALGIKTFFNSEKEESCFEMLKKLETVFAYGPMSYAVSDLKWELEKMERDNNSSEEIFDKNIEELDMVRWEVFKDNREIREIFGDETIEKFCGYLEERIREQLIKNYTDRNSSSVQLGFKLLPFKSKETIPVVVMNAYREPGYSGENPFISIHEESSKDTELFKYVDFLNKEDLKNLKEPPEILELIELIRKNPETFNKRMVGERGKELRNPVYDRIQYLLSQIGLYYLEKDDPDMQKFAVDLLKKRDCDTGEKGKEILPKIFFQTEDVELQEWVLEYCEKSAENFSNFETIGVLLSYYQNLTEQMQNRMRKSAIKLLEVLIKKNTDTNILENISQVMGRNASELSQVIDFVRQIKNINHLDYNFSEKLDDYIELSKNKDILSLINNLAQFGYNFNICHADILPKAVSKETEIVSNINIIKKIFPNFVYNFLQNENYDSSGSKEQTIFINPYDILVRKNSPQVILNQLSKVQAMEENTEKKFTDALMEAMRESDPLLAEKKEAGAFIKEEHKTDFYDGIKKMLAALNMPGSEIAKYKEIFFDINLIRFIARQPEKTDDIIKLPEVAPDFFNILIAEGGALYNNKDIVFKDIFNNGDPTHRLKEIEAIFTKKMPYWKQLYFFTDTRIGEQLADCVSDYPITQIGDVPLDSLVKRHNKEKKVKPEKLTRLEKIINNEEILVKLTRGEITSIPFSSIFGTYKRLIFRDYLKKTIETSRSEEAKSIAEIRNSSAGEELALSAGMYIHGSGIENLDSVLLNGNLPGEALGEGAETDVYPFQLDFTKLETSFIKSQDSNENIFLNSLSAAYGTNGVFMKEGQIFYVYDRSQSNWEKGKEYGASEYHALMLGGLPSTEISTIVLRSPAKTLSMAKKAVSENGFFIPIYDIQGRLLFSFDDYKKIKEDFNLEIPVEVWDFSLKTGDQRGSNRGAEFTVPSEKSKQPDKYYTKYASKENLDHIWNEKLADDIYRVLGVAVPETKIVRVNGSYGHASLLKEGNHGSMQEILQKVSYKEGFIADSLLANWDIPYAAERNTFIGKNGKVYRIDNGGALLFRAKGERKTGEQFGGEVREIEEGANEERLGLGMRQKYSDITDKEIKKQVENLKNILTDDTIECLVDGVRLKQKDRNALKQILKARRDFIVSKFL